MTDTKVKLENTRSIVLLEDVDKLGKSTELVRAHLTRAGQLVDSGKARWATKADFGIA